MRFLKDEQGQATILVAVCMVAVVGIAGLAVDVGHLRYVRRQMQTLADSAALAGATELSYCGETADCGAMQTAAQEAITENGASLGTFLTQCSGSVSGLTLELNNGPCALNSADPNNGDANYVEAVVTQTEPMYFAKILGLNSMTISARAEARISNSPYCVVALGSAGLTFQSNGGGITASCGLMVDSDSTTAFQANGANVSATAISVDGGDQINGGTVSPTPVTGAPPLSDPLNYLTPPSSSGCTYSSTYSVNSGAKTLSAGTYCGGIQLNGGTLSLNPGTYILDGIGLQINSGSLSGTGVTLYIAQGSVQFNGANGVDLVAPTTGAYAGILFYQSATDAGTAQINGGANAAFQGSLYFPDSPVQLNGSNTAAYTIVVSRSVQINGSDFNIGSDYSSLPNGSPIKSTTGILVE
ncbi:MAG TPA: pilus assembly protein TadG-related protein [Acidobacteriaceae bacterium]|jgi:Flp pilus assembly protein TadG|nr:pilus assembly protein TadG-related protein [Acidobacteriaceae bacterium]